MYFIFMIMCSGWETETGVPRSWGCWGCDRVGLGNIVFLCRFFLLVWILEDGWCLCGGGCGCRVC